MINLLRRFNNHPHRDVIGLLVALFVITIIPLGAYLLGFNGLLVQHIGIVVLAVITLLLCKVGR